MDHIAKCKVASFLPAATTATAATALRTVDTLGCSRAHIYVVSGSHTTTSNVFSDVDVYHHTGTTVTSGTLISAASFGTETSTAAANIVPTGALNGIAGGNIEIHLDLKGLERYVGIKTTRDDTPAANADEAVLVLLEPQVSADSTTDKQLINYGAGTAVQAVGTVTA